METGFMIIAAAAVLIPGLIRLLMEAKSHIDKSLAHSSESGKHIAHG